MEHIIAEIRTQKQDQHYINTLLNKLTVLVEGAILQGPALVQQKGGLTAYTITEYSHVAIHTGRTVIVDMHSSKPFDKDRVRNTITDYLDCAFNDIRMRSISEMAVAMIECEEPRCIAPATKEYGGRRVCADHYEQYMDKESSMYDFDHD